MKNLVASLILVAISANGQEFWPRHTIDASDKTAGKLGADGVRLADANGDGFLDVVTGWENGDAIRVCLNPTPEKAKQPWPAVTVGKVRGAEDAVFADLDGDGALDVVSCCEGKTRAIFAHWAPSEAADYLKSEAWKTAEFPSAKKANQAWMFCVPMDVDRDGAIDLVVGSKDKGATVSWLRNPGNAEARDLEKWKLTKICDAGWIMSIFEADLDGDENPDLVISDRKWKGAGIYWLKTKAETPYFEPPILLGAAGEEVMFLDVADVNGDGRLDVAAAIRQDQIGFLYQPEENAAAGNWERKNQTDGVPQNRFGGSKAVRIADMDGDGQLDFVLTCEGANGKLSGAMRAPVHTGPLAGKLFYENISGSEGVKFDRIELLDLDGDGDLDVMTCEERDGLGVFWYENPHVKK